LISVKNVTKTYGKRASLFRALEDVTFDIPDGASVAIVGKSGSGKSTLMHAMSGLDRPQKGEIVIDGQNILRLRSRAIDRFRSRSIGFIFQAFFVQANETCYQNIALPLEIAKVPFGRRRHLIRTALEKVDMLDKISSKARNLSGGQRQRLAIARAIVNNPQIIFADEPTGNLDSVTGAKIEKLLFDLNRQAGGTLIIVTHDHDLASRCDMRIHIKDGRIQSIEGRNAK